MTSIWVCVCNRITPFRALTPRAHSDALSHAQKRASSLRDVLCHHRAGGGGGSVRNLLPALFPRGAACDFAKGHRHRDGHHSFLCPFRLRDTFRARRHLPRAAGCGRGHPRHHRARHDLRGEDRGQHNLAARKRRGASQSDDIAVFPLATPILAGPGACRGRWF